MANLRYFADLNGTVVSIPAQKVGFRTVDGREVRMGWHAETSQWLKIERVVEFKTNPSRHECDDRCVNATGKVMRCECSCGGKNHGKGTPVPRVAPAQQAAF